MKIGVVTDTAADLPPEIIEEFDIAVVPQIVTFNDKAMKLGEDISYSEYYKLLDTLETIPSTASPDPASYYKVYREFIEDKKCNYVFCVTVSKELSGTFSSAKIGAKKIGDKIVIINSGSASGVEGLIALNIAKLGKKGKSVKEIEDTVNKMIEGSCLGAGFQTFENIHKFGRMKSKFIYNLTKLLMIKPILILENEVLKPKIPGFFTENHMMNRLVKIVLKNINRNLTFDIVISHVDNLEGANKLLTKISNKIKIKETYITSATPLVGTHTGWNTVILSLVPSISNKNM